MTQRKSGQASEQQPDGDKYQDRDWLLISSRLRPGYNGPQVYFRNQKRKSKTLEPLLAVNTTICQTYWNFRERRQYLRSATKSLLATPLKIANVMRSRSGYAKSAFGRSYLGQYTDILKAWWYADLQPKEYYEALLARHHGGPELFEYFDADSVFRVIAVLQLDLFGEPSFQVNDKAMFGDWLSKNDLPCAAEFTVPDGQADIDRDRLNALGNEIVIKPSRSGFGRSVEVWSRKGDLTWRTPERELSTDNLIAHIKEWADTNSGGVVVQERLQNHADVADLCGKGLATCRFITIRNEQGALETVMHYWRMAWPGGHVDNFHAGGFYWITDDIETGALVHGVDAETQAKQRLLTHHPVTGAYMIGFAHPHYAELKALAIRAHEKLPELMFAGWDVAMTTEGPKLIELNTPCSFPPRIQMITDGLGRSRCGQILSYYAEQWLQQRSRKKPNIPAR